MNAKIDIGLVDLNNAIQPPGIRTSGVMDQSQGPAIFGFQFTIDANIRGIDLDATGRHQIQELHKARNSPLPLRLLFRFSQHADFFQQKIFEEQEGVPRSFLSFFLFGRQRLYEVEDLGFLLSEARLSKGIGETARHASTISRRYHRLVDAFEHYIAHGFGPWLLQGEAALIQSNNLRTR